MNTLLLKDEKHAQSFKITNKDPFRKCCRKSVHAGVRLLVRTEDPECTGLLRNMAWRLCTLISKLSFLPIPRPPPLLVYPLFFQHSCICKHFLNICHTSGIVLDTGDVEVNKPGLRLK